MSHTKGEWTIETEDTKSFNFVIVRKSDPHTSVAAIFGGIPEDEEKANAHLIAAAPDLLEMCKKLLSFVESYGDFRHINEASCYHCLLINKSKVAISKAKSKPA